MTVVKDSPRNIGKSSRNERTIAVTVYCYVNKDYMAKRNGEIRRFYEEMRPRYQIVTMCDRTSQNSHAVDNVRKRRLQ